MTDTLNLREAYLEQTRIRRQLLDNGYRPLPTAEKVAFLKAWPTIPVTDRVIERWPQVTQRLGENGALRMVPAVTTAIQLTGTMLAIDVDVQDNAVAGQVEDLAAEHFGQQLIAEAPYRHSGGAKFMLLLRTPEPFAMWKTAKYVDPDGRDHMVEVFGGAATRYFSCYGPHTLGDVVDGRYEVAKAYEWLEGKEPLNTPPDDLPLVQTEQLDAFMRAAADLLRGQPGWERVSESKEGHGSGGVEYDLTDDMTFETKEGELDYYEAIAYAMLERDARCSASFIDGQSHNQTRCRMRAVGEGDDVGLQVFDHETWLQYLPKDWAPRTREERDERTHELGERLAALLPGAVEVALFQAQEQGQDTAEFEEMLDELRETLAFNYVTGTFHYLRRGMIWSGVAKSTLKDDLRQYDLTWEGPRGGARRFSIVDAWASFDDKKRIAGVRFNPKTEDRIYVGYDGELYGNGFFGLSEPDAAVVGSDSPVLKAFLEHLVPHDDEREWLLDWLATKYQQPWKRSCAVVFVAAGVQGAGRGTLFSILDRVFNRYTTVTSESDLLGARFNGFMENNLLVFSNELGGMGWADRKRGYETLKDRVDPAHHMINVERKGIEAYRTETFASFMLATNNPGGLTMDAEDRRFAIITNGVKLEGRLLSAILSIGVDTLAKHMAAMLSGREVTREVTDAPQFDGREAMLEANTTELDEAIREVIEAAPEWRAWRRSDFEKLVKLAYSGSTKDRVPGLRQAVTNLVGKRAVRMGAEAMSQKVRLTAGAVNVVAKNPVSLLALSPEDRERVLGGHEPSWDGTNVTPFR